MIHNVKQKMQTLCSLGVAGAFQIHGDKRKEFPHTESFLYWCFRSLLETKKTIVLLTERIILVDSAQIIRVAAFFVPIWLAT